MGAKRPTSLRALRKGVRWTASLAIFVFMKEITELQKGRETTYEEVATWGTCPICNAGPGEWCHAEIGIQLGSSVCGGKMKTGSGAHLARLQKAPNRIRLVAEEINSIDGEVRSK